MESEECRPDPYVLTLHFFEERLPVRPVGNPR